MICEVRRQKWKDNGWRGGALDAPEISGWEWHFKVEGDGKHLAQGSHDREASSKESSRLLPGEESKLWDPRAEESQRY